MVITSPEELPNTIIIKVNDYNLRVGKHKDCGNCDSYGVWSNDDVSINHVNNNWDYITKERIEKNDKESDILNTLKEMTKGFSYKRKLQVLASVGNNLLGGYDKSRTQDDKKSFKGVVTTEDMFSAMRRSLINGDKIDAGVCRDMHLSMAKMARAMGIKNAYGVGYATRASGHLILTTTPDSYGTVSTVNYNRIEHSKGVTGAGALELQGGMPNWGTAMYISNGENNTEVLAIPTRLGQALSVASGGEVDSLLFGAQDNGNVLRAGAKTKFGNIIYSHQELSDGTPGKVSGLFYQLDKSIFSFINFNGAIGYIESEREAGNENLYESGMYVRTSTRIGDHIPLTKKLSIYPFATHHYSYLSSCRRTDSNPDCVENDKTISTEKRIRQNTYTSNIIAGTGLYFRDTHLKANIAYKFRMQNLLDDARDANSPRNYRPSQHQFSMNAEHLSDHFNIGGSAKLVLSDLKDQVVKTYQASGHITYLPIGISLLGEATGRFDSAGRVVPAWLPGSENRQTYRLTKSFESIGNNLGIEYQRSDDFPELNSGFFIFRLGDE